MGSPGKRVYGLYRTEGSNPSLSANKKNPPRAGFFIANVQAKVQAETLAGPGLTRLFYEVGQLLVIRYE
jgi:hypothetical protein